MQGVGVFMKAKAADELWALLSVRETENDCFSTIQEIRFVGGCKVFISLQFCVVADLTQNII